jgi:hypothetical protein
VCKDGSKRQRSNLITLFSSEYKLNTEETTTLRGGHLLAVGDLSAYQQTRLYTTLQQFKHAQSHEGDLLRLREPDDAGEL